MEIYLQIVFGGLVMHNRLSFSSFAAPTKQPCPISVSEQAESGQLQLQVGYQGLLTSTCSERMNERQEVQSFQQLALSDDHYLLSLAVIPRTKQEVMFSSGSRRI